MASILLTPFAVNGSCIITFTQCVCTGHMGVRHSPSVYILWTLGSIYQIKPSYKHTHNSLGVS